MEECVQIVVEGEIDFFVYLCLLDVWQVIFDGIFEGKDGVFELVDCVECGVECCGFFVIGWVGDQDYVVRMGDSYVEGGFVFFLEIE